MRQAASWLPLAALASTLIACGRASQDPSPCENGDAPWQSVAVDASLVPARSRHTAVWTGTEVLVWGGLGSDGLALDSGFRWDPRTNVARPIATRGAPSARFGHYATWTGSAMLVFGGLLDERAESHFGIAAEGGAFYDPQKDEWTALPTESGPGARECAATLWTSKGLLVWGGVRDPNLPTQDYRDDGAFFDPERGQWAPVAAPDWESGGYCDAQMLATASGAVVVGGDLWRFEPSSASARYDGPTNTWEATPAGKPPSAGGFEARSPAFSVGTELAFCSRELACSALSADGTSWRELAAPQPPATRFQMGWAERAGRLFAFGGAWWDATGERIVFADGGIYDWERDVWQDLPDQCRPSARSELTATWTDAGVLVWGGRGEEQLATDIGWFLRVAR